MEGGSAGEQEEIHNLGDRGGCQGVVRLVNRALNKQLAQMEAARWVWRDLEVLRRYLTGFESLCKSACGTTDWSEGMCCAAQVV